MGYTKYEQETNVNMNREDDYVVVYTRNAKHIRAIKNDNRFTLVGVDYDPETHEVDSLTAHISLDHFDPLTGLKRRKRDISEEERAAMGARLAEARAKRNA